MALARKLSFSGNIGFKTVAAYPYLAKICERAFLTNSCIRERSEMEKYMCYGALGVAGLFFLLSLLDLIIAYPFGRGAFLVGDIFMLIISGMVGYLGYNALRDLK
jgi:hypothetical protein